MLEMGRDTLGGPAGADCGVHITVLRSAETVRVPFFFLYAALPWGMAMVVAQKRESGTSSDTEAGWKREWNEYLGR